MVIYLDVTLWRIVLPPDVVGMINTLRYGLLIRLLFFFIVLIYVLFLPFRICNAPLS